MIDWVHEKVSKQAEEVGSILRELDRGQLDPESRREVRASLHTIYAHSAIIAAFATGGFPEDLVTRIDASFAAGPAEMNRLMEELWETRVEGWELPNPNYERAIVIDRLPRNNLS